MATLKISYKASEKKARVQYANDALLAGYSQLGGTFTHDLSKGPYGPVAIETLYQVARTRLEALGIVNMQFIEINLDEVINVASITISPSTVTKVVGQTQQLTINWTPSDSTIKTIASWVSSDPTKATVNATGLVTAVAAGTTTITATTTDGAKTATKLVTVTSS